MEDDETHAGGGVNEGRGPAAGGILYEGESYRESSEREKHIKFVLSRKQKKLISNFVRGSLSLFVFVCTLYDNADVTGTLH